MNHKTKSLVNKANIDGVSIIIPAYNEEKGIAGTLEEIRRMTKNLEMECEVIVVDDGSKDNTAGIAAQNGDTKIIQHTHNRGYGAALKTGIHHATYDTVVITDADGTYPNADIPLLLAEVEQYDCEMVVGARTGENVRIPFIRKPAKWTINKLANYLSRTKIPDLNSGLRIMKKSVVEKYLGILPDGFSFTTTITLAMLANGYLVRYIPIDYRKREGKSKIKPIRDTLNFIQLIVKTVLYFEPLRVFTPLSMVFIFASLGVLLYSFFFKPQIMDITTLVLFVTGVQMLAIGMLADLINKRLR